MGFGLLNYTPSILYSSSLCDTLDLHPLCFLVLLFWFQMVSTSIFFWCFSMVLLKEHTLVIICSAILRICLYLHYLLKQLTWIWILQLIQIHHEPLYPWSGVCVCVFHFHSVCMFLSLTLLFYTFHYYTLQPVSWEFHIFFILTCDLIFFMLVVVVSNVAPISFLYSIFLCLWIYLYLQQKNQGKRHLIYSKLNYLFQMDLEMLLFYRQLLSR